MVTQIDEGIDFADPSDDLFQRLVRADLKETKMSCELSLAKHLQNALLVQSVLGHAQEGHKVFYEEGMRYPFATITNIIEAAGLNLANIKGLRQKAIDNVFEWVELAKQDKTDRLLIKGQPLLGVEFLREHHINPEYVLKGMVLAGMMDNYSWRQNTVKKYQGKTIQGRPLVIGGGETYLIDPIILARNDPLFLEQLADQEISDLQIEQLSVEGAITTSNNPKAEVAYIRRKIGLGTSDDAAFIMMGEMYKKEGIEKAISAFLGGFIVDGVDTYDKCTLKPIAKGYDEKIGQEIRIALPSLVSNNEITTLIHYSAKGNGERLVSCSHKRLIQTVATADPKMPTLLHHLKFLETGSGKYAPFKLGFENMPSHTFYGNLQERIQHYKKHQ